MPRVGKEMLPISGTPDHFTHSLYIHYILLNFSGFNIMFMDYIYTLVTKRKVYFGLFSDIAVFLLEPKYRRHGNIRASILHLLNPKTGIFSDSVGVWRRVKAMGGKVQQWHFGSNSYSVIN